MAEPRMTTFTSAGMEPGVSVCVTQSELFATPMGSIREPMGSIVALPVCVEEPRQESAESRVSSGKKAEASALKDSSADVPVQKKHTNHVTLQLTPEVLASHSAGHDAEDDPPLIFGYMYKKTPEMLRFFKPFDWRFFVVCDGKLIWWRDMESCLPPPAPRGDSLASDIMAECTEAEHNPRIRGLVNLNVSQARVSADARSDTLFYLAPVGKWAEGSTTDKYQDENRVYVLDATDSEHPREVWINAIQKHIDKANAKLSRKSTAKSGHSEYWEDDTVDEEQQKALARLTARIEARRAATGGSRAPRGGMR